MKPIIFSTPMVQAILDGRKTQTRRVIKINGCPITSPKESLELTKEGLIYHSFCSMSGYYKLLCQPGDILWVRETWFENEECLLYKASKYENTKEYHGRNGWVQIKWRPSIFMPREAARIFLRVTNVRVERLQDITEVEAIDEGALTVPNTKEYQKAFGEAVAIGEKPPLGETPKQRFARLWDSINAKRGYSWESNPWVWVIEFERVENPLEN